MGELALNLFGLVLLIVATLLAIRAGANWLSRAMWRSGRPRLVACAERIAATLQMTPIDALDPARVLWHGRMADAELWLTAGAHPLGSEVATFDFAGPMFIDGQPRLKFSHLINVLLLVRYARPLPVAFELTNLYGMQPQIRLGDRAFDARFKLKGEDVPAIQALFAASALRDALLGIFGPDARVDGLVLPFGRPRRRDETGVLMCANAEGLVVSWSSPNEQFAADFATAVALAGSALAAAGREQPARSTHQPK